jgi:hypothetical protein
MFLTAAPGRAGCPMNFWVRVVVTGLRWPLKGNPRSGKQRDCIMRRAKLEMCLVVVVVTSILSFALGADRKGKARDGARIHEPQSGTDVDEIARLNAVLSDDGHWAIAGVVALSKDADGRTVIEVKKDGDFDRDMVLTLPVHVIDLDDGETMVGGIVGVSLATDTLTIRMEDMSLGGVAAADCNYDQLRKVCVKSTCAGSCSMGSTPESCDCSVIVWGPEP